MFFVIRFSPRKAFCLLLEIIKTLHKKLHLLYITFTTSIFSPGDYVTSPDPNHEPIPAVIDAHERDAVTQDLTDLLHHRGVAEAGIAAAGFGCRFTWRI